MVKTLAPWLLDCEEVEEARDYLLSSGLWADCTFVVGSGSNETVIQAHKLILAIESPVFDAMFYGGLSECNDPIVSIPDVPPEAFRALLQYIYTCSTDIDSMDMACDLWYAADKYMMPNLAKICYTHVWLYVGPGNACQAYQFASLFNKKTIVDKCIQIISSNTKEVLNDSSFEDVELNTVITVCSLDNLNVDSELELFHAVARYAEASQRRQREISPPVDEEPPSKKLCKSLRHTSTSDEMALPRAGSSSQRSPGAQLHSEPAPELVTSEPTADKDNIKDELPNIRGALQKIRFLSMTAQEFEEGPARSGLLPEAESHAVLSNIACRDSPVPMPTGFSERRERRQPPNDSVDEGPLAKPRPKPTEPRCDGFKPDPSKIVLGLASSDREILEDAARAARHMSCADADGTESLNQLVAAGGVSPLVAALDHPWTGIQYDAAWAITNIASGEHANLLPDAVPVLVGLLGRAGGGAVAAQAAWALGNIAVYNKYAKNAVLEAGVIPALLPHMQPSTPAEQLATYVRTYRMICQKDMYSGWHARHFELLSGVPNIENLLVLADEQVLVQACWALHHLVGGGFANSDLFTATLAARVAAVLRPGAAAPVVQTAALAAVRRMLRAMGSTTERALEAGCFDHVLTFLKCGNPLQAEYAAMAASNILADTNHYIQRALDKGILDALVPALMTGNNACKHHAACAVKNLCERGSPAQLGQLAASAALEPYCRRLTANDDNVLQGLTNLLQNVEQNCKPDLILKLQDIGVPQLLTPLQRDTYRWKRERANELLQTYFSNDQ